MATTTSVVITGASGLLGRAIYAHFKAHPQFHVTGLCYTRQKGDLVSCDLTDREAVKKIFQKYEPKVLIHSAAQRRPDIVEKLEDQTKQINVSATEYLKAEAVASGCLLIYISTDYVFDGTNPPYTVTSPTNPLNKYGMSKLAGEKVILSGGCEGCCVLRVPVLYGQVETLDESAVTVLFKTLQQSHGKPVDDYQRRYPTHVDDIAAVCRQLSNLHLKSKGSVNGIYHWASTEESMTKYDMVKEMANMFNLSIDHVIRDDGPPPPGAIQRPYNVKLDLSRLKDLGLGQQTLFSTGIKECLNSFHLEKQT